MASPLCLGVHTHGVGCQCLPFSLARSSQRGPVGDFWGERPVGVGASLLEWVVILGKAPTVCIHLSGVLYLYYLPLAGPSALT